MAWQRISHRLDAVNAWTGKTAAWLIWVVMILCVFEVVSRRLLNLPHKWSYDVIDLFYSLHFMLLGGYALLHKSHVSVDIFSNRLSPRLQGGLRVLTYLIFFFPFLGVLFWVGWSAAASSWSMQERTSIGLPLIFPLMKSAIPAAALLLFLQGVAEFIRSIQAVGKPCEREDPC